MNEGVTVSVIMSVYNTARYVARAIESIRAQTLADIEFLIVNDGSTDESGEIIDRFARLDDRIIAIHRENGGVPSARNEAIARSCGKYLYFFDPDDWVEPDALEAMARYAEANRLQLTICGFYIHTYYDSKHSVDSLHSAPNQIFESKQAFREQAYRLFDINLLYPPWNKLYEARYIRENGFRFPETFWDDFPFNLDVIRDVERVGVLEKPYYHFYRVREESETSRYRENFYEKREEEHQWMLELYEHWGVHDEASMEMLHRRYIERIVGCIENIANPACVLSIGEKLGRVRRILSDEKVRKAVEVARPRSFHMKVMLLPIRWRWVLVAYLEGFFISRVKSRNMRIFASLKARR